MKKEKVAGASRLWVRSPRGATGYCPGCHHSVIERLVSEALEELGMGEEAIAICGVGCNYMGFTMPDIDGTNAPHGRAPDIATGLK